MHSWLFMRIPWPRQCSGCRSSLIGWRESDAHTSKFSIGEALRFGWDTLKHHLAFFVGVALLGMVLSHSNALLASGILRERRGLAGLVQMLLGAVGLILSMGSIRVGLRFCDHEKATVADLLSPSPVFWRFLLASLAYGVGIMASVLCTTLAVFIVIFEFMVMRHGNQSLVQSVAFSAAGAVAMVPAYRLTIWVVDRQFFGHLLVDRRVRAGEALRQSASITRPARGRLVLFDSVLFGIGMIFTVPYLLMGAQAGLPRDVNFPLPHLAVPLPPPFATVLREFVLFLDALLGWLAFLAHTFVYRRLEAQARAPAGSDAPPFFPNQAR